MSARILMEMHCRYKCAASWPTLRLRSRARCPARLAVILVGGDPARRSMCGTRWPACEKAGIKSLRNIPRTSIRPVCS